MSYTVRRSTSRGGPYTTVAAGLDDSATYIDTTVTNGTSLLLRRDRKKPCWRQRPIPTKRKRLR
jgi:hypothetical protein